MNLVQNNNGRKRTLTLTGTVDQLDTCRIHRVLAEAIRNYAHVAVHVPQVEALDFSFLKLVCAAHRTAESQNKNFTLTLEEPEPIKELLVQCGFQCYYSSDADNLEQCVWHAAVFQRARPHQDNDKDGNANGKEVTSCTGNI